MIWQHESFLARMKWQLEMALQALGMIGQLLANHISLIELHVTFLAWTHLKGVMNLPEDLEN